MRKEWHIVVLVLAVLAGLLVALVVGSVALLSTSSGQNWVARNIERLTQGPDFRLELDGLELGSRTRVHGLRIFDAQGMWLEAEDIVVQAELRAALRGAIVLREMSAARVHMLRLPGTGSNAENAADSSTDIETSLALRILIDQISCPLIELGPEVMGQEARFGLHGNGQLAWPTAQAELDIVRLDRPADRLELRATYALDQAEVALYVSEDPGGLLHTLLADTSAIPISVRFSGAGPLTSWPLVLSGELGQWGRAEVNATLNAQSSGQARFAGLLQLGEAVLEHTGLDLDPVITLDGEVGWADGILTVRQAELRHQAAHTVLTGSYGLEHGAVEAQVNGSMGDLSWLTLPDVQPGAGEWTAQISGQADDLRIQAEVRARDWEVHGVLFPVVRLRSDLVFPAHAPWQAKAELNVDSNHAPWNATQCTADITGNSTGLCVESLQVCTGPLTLTGVAELIPQNASTTLNCTVGLDVASTSLLALGLGEDTTLLQGHVDAHLLGTIFPEEERVQLKAQVQAKDMQGLPAELGQLLGPSPRFTARLVRTGPAMRLEEARLNAPMSFSAHGEMNTDSGQVAGQADISLPAMERADLRLSKGASVHSTIQGHMDNFSAQLHVTSPELLLDRMQLAKIDLNSLTTGLPEKPCSQADFRLLANAIQVQGKARAQWVENEGQVQGQVDMPGTTVSAKGTYTSQGNALGTLDMHSTDLGPLLRGLGLQGQGRLSAQAQLKEIRGEQAVDFQTSGTGLTSADARVDAVEMSGVFFPTRGLDQSRLDMRAQGVSIGDYTGATASVQIQGQAEHAELTGRFTHADSTSDVRLSAQIQAITEVQARIQEFHGTILGQPLKLARPMEVHAGQALSWSDLVLRFGSAELRSTGIVGPDQVDASAALAGMRLDELRSLVPGLPEGTLDMQAFLRGPASDPRLEVKMACPDLNFASEDMDIPPLAASVQAVVAQGQAELQATLDAPDRDIHAATRLTLPVVMRCAPWTVDVSPDAPLSGQVDARLQLDFLAPVLQLDDQRFNGLAQGQFRLGGTGTAPTVHGDLGIMNATYENFRTGTWLQDVHGTLRARGTTADLALHGTDGQNGTLDVQGHVDLPSVRYAVDVRTASARLVRQDYLQSTVSSDVRMQGKEAVASVRGEIHVESTDFHIPPTLPPDVTTIDIAEINAPAKASAASTEPGAMRLDMDLSVNVPNQFIVRGRGLDSEWSGALQIKGSHTEPHITGDVRLLRGHFDFLDRLFVLSKGLLSLDGSVPPNPYLDIVGETEISDTLAGIHITGPAKNFRLMLSSVPALPTDEILALILFGRSSRQISPLQAIQLAQAAAEMAGGATPDVLGSLKSTLGLQEVSMDSEDKDTSVGVGGYVGGKYYVRTQRSVSGQDKTKVEVQLTPSISVETEVGGDSRQGGGVSWKHSY
ncbi:translocation/assembly module TamB domain-containing protein [Desulfovibrionales bacterium]